MYYPVGLPFLEHQTTRPETAPGSQHCTSVCNLLHKPKPIIDHGSAARQSPSLLKQSQQNPMGLFHSCIFEQEYPHPLKFPFLSSALFLSLSTRRVFAHHLFSLSYGQFFSGCLYPRFAFLSPLLWPEKSYQL